MRAGIPLAMDQRAHPRVPLVLPGLLTLESGRTFACQVTDISSGGAGLRYAGRAPRPGQMASLAIPDFGKFKGATVRPRGSSPALRFVDGEADRTRLTTRLVLYVEEGLADVTPQQRWPKHTQVSLSRTSGITEGCDVLDISLRGVSLATGQRPPLGELVRLGRMYGRVTGHLKHGLEISFLNFVPPAEAGAA